MSVGKHAIHHGKQLTKDNIFKLIDSMQIFSYYLGRIKIPMKMNSPFPDRKDKRPSFGLFGRNNTDILWKDFATGEVGGAIEFVGRMYNLNYKESLVKINEDMRLNLQYNKDKYNNIPTLRKTIPKKVQFKTTRVSLSITIHKDINDNPIYTSTDIQYWKKRHITNIPQRLIRNHCYSSKFVFKNNSLMWEYKHDNPIYSYIYKVKDEYRYKVYRPFSIEGKFYNDMRGVTDKCIHGLWYLNKTGNDLIITKSGKDCIVLDELGFNVVAVQGEGMFMNEAILLDLKQRYKNIYLLFDNDYNKKENYGQILANKVIQKYNFINNIYIPSQYKCTDSDDLVLKVGKNETYNIINNLIT